MGTFPRGDGKTTQVSVNSLTKQTFELDMFTYKGEVVHDYAFWRIGLDGIKALHVFESGTKEAPLLCIEFSKPPVVYNPEKDKWLQAAPSYTSASIQCKSAADASAIAQLFAGFINTGGGKVAVKADLAAFQSQAQAALKIVKKDPAPANSDPVKTTTAPDATKPAAAPETKEKAPPEKTPKPELGPVTSEVQDLMDLLSAEVTLDIHQYTGEVGVLAKVTAVNAASFTLRVDAEGGDVRQSDTVTVPWAKITSIEYCRIPTSGNPFIRINLSEAVKLERKGTLSTTTESVMAVEAWSDSGSGVESLADALAKILRLRGKVIRLKELK